MGIYGTLLNDSTKVKLINKGSITFVSPFFANAMLCAVLIQEDGRKEVIIKVPISATGSRKIIELITKTLSETKKDIQSDEICEKHSWIKTKRGRICENCGEWTQHYR